MNKIIIFAALACFIFLASNVQAADWIPTGNISMKSVYWLLNPAGVKGPLNVVGNINFNGFYAVGYGLLVTTVGTAGQRVSTIFATTVDSTNVKATEINFTRANGNDVYIPYAGNSSKYGHIYHNGTGLIIES